MLSNKPYLIRAFYDWIVDSQCTPIIVVNASFPRCQVPKDFIENGEIVLNVDPKAIRDFKITKDIIEFKASFSGIVHLISVPVKAILAVYANENQQGMYFDYEEEDTIENGEGEGFNIVSADQTNETSEAKKSKSHLRLVE